MRHFLIWSIEHEMWWRDGRNGYTDRVRLAGVYSDVDSKEILERANQIEVNECRIPLLCIARSIYDLRHMK